MSIQLQAAVGTIDLPTVRWVLIVIAVLVVVIGIIVCSGRVVLGQQDSANSMVRSWLALALVAGLLVFCGISLGIDDSSMRSTLFGGLIASAGAGTAFYFASKTSDQARKDILDASFGTVEVPKLTDGTVNEARQLMSSTALELRTQPSDAPAGDTVIEQKPDAGTTVRRGSLVLITTKAATPPPANGH